MFWTICTLHCTSCNTGTENNCVFQLKCISLFSVHWTLRGRGCRGAMIPAKMISEPQDLQNYLQAPQNWSPSLSDVTKFKFIGLTKQISKYLHSRLRHSLKNRVMNKFDMLIHSIVLEVILQILRLAGHFCGIMAPLHPLPR